MTQLHNVRVPPAMLARMESARDAQEEGIQIALEIIERLRTLKGVSGIHLMAMGWEVVIPRLVVEAGLNHDRDCRDSKDAAQALRHPCEGSEIR